MKKKKIKENIYLTNSRKNYIEEHTSIFIFTDIKMELGKDLTKKVPCKKKRNLVKLSQASSEKTSTAGYVFILLNNKAVFFKNLLLCFCFNWDMARCNP